MFKYNCKYFIVFLVGLVILLSGCNFKTGVSENNQDKKPDKLNLNTESKIVDEEYTKITSEEIEKSNITPKNTLKTNNNNTQAIKTSDKKDNNITIPDLSDKIYGWGFTRQPGKFPIFDATSTQLVNKYSSVYIGNTSTKKVYITFDEGYENGYSNRILDALKSNNVKAAFFITGSYLNKNRAIVDRMVNEGHLVGNHTVNHPSLPTIIDSEIKKEVLDLENSFKSIYGVKMNYLRPPMGEFSERSLSTTKKLGYTNVFWSFAYDDWDTTKIRGADYAYNIVTENLHNGAILLLHAVSKDNAEALDRIIKEIKNRNYIIGSPWDLTN